MATQTDAALAEALRAFVENAAQAKNFALEQAPDVIQQLLLWTAMDAAIGAVLGGALLYGGVRGLRWGYAAAGKFDTELGGVFGCIGAVMVGVFGAVSLVCNASTLLKVLLAPKVFLLEYAAHLVK